MATRAVFTPLAAEFPATNFPALTLINRRPVLAFDATTSETAQWTGAAPTGLTGALTAVITYMMASGVTGGVVFDVSVEAVTDGDATDLDAVDSFDTANENGDLTVPGTAGHIDQISITLTTNDSLTAADYFRLRIARDVANANDDATGDCYVLGVEFRDSA